jgi:hypothetical protein
LFPTTAFQQRQRVDAVRCRPFLAGWSSCLFLILCKFLVGVYRFVVGTLHPIAPPGYGPGKN